MSSFPQPNTPLLAGSRSGTSQPSPVPTGTPLLRAAAFSASMTPGTPLFRASAFRASMTPGTGTPLLRASAFRASVTPGTPLFRPSPAFAAMTPENPQVRPFITQVASTPRIPLFHSVTPVPPTPTSSFVLSVAGMSSSDEEDMDTNENVTNPISGLPERVHDANYSSPATTTSNPNLPHDPPDSDPASSEGEEADGRVTPSSQDSSGSSGLYSPLPCSSYGQFVAELGNETLDEGSEITGSSRDAVVTSAWSQRREAALSPASTSGQKTPPPSFHSSRPTVHDPVASTPLDAEGAETNFQSWMAARGDRESIISYIRSIPTPSAAARAAQRQSNWSTPARTSTSLTETVIGSEGSINEDVLRRRRQILEGIHDDDERGTFSDTVLSVVWGGGKFGAAYYNIESSELFLVPDIAESAPDFTILHTLNRQIRPKFLVASSRQDERFLEVLKNMTMHNVPGPENIEVTREEDGPQLFIQSGRDFAPDSCRQRLQALKLPEESKYNDAREHLLFITSLIPFSNEIMVRAAGALLKFLDKSAIELLQLDLVDGVVPVLSVNISSMDELVMVDETAWNSLQIFSVDFHPAASTKLGNWGGCKEGLSVFNLLNRCNSTQGTKALKLQLLRPTRDMKLLNRRYDVIEYCVDPGRTDFVRAAANYMKSIKSIPKLLFKLSMLHTTVREWKELYQTIYHCLLLGELTASQLDTVELFKEIGAECKSEVLRATSQEMMRIIDFEESSLKGHFVSKHGITPELDKKRQEYACLPEVMSMVAAEEMTTLPEFVQQCSVVYLPEVGYLLALSHWREGLEMDDFKLEGLEFKFTSQDLVYYKSPRVNELDIVLGDCQIAIMDLEACIMIYLTETILKNSTSLLKISTLVSELDSLMAMASVAREYNYIRPTLVPGHERIEIIGGRHPLVEQICDFVPNSTIFEGNEKIVILTGPNASGKSIYLKQVAVLVLMALSGSFVPATSAVIPTVDRVCTRIHAKESVSTGFSTFLIDINQMSLALRSASKCSLVIVDEFGKGTAEADGLALLISTMEDFTRRGEDSPTIFVSTHYYSLMDHLDYSPLLKPQTMEFMKDGNRIVYLFKLKSGSCKSSFAHLVAENVGIPEASINRSLEIEELLHRQLGEESIEALQFGLNRKRLENLMTSLGDEFLALDLDSIDPLAYMHRISSLMKPLMHDDESPLVTCAEYENSIEVQPVTPFPAGTSWNSVPETMDGRSMADGTFMNSAAGAFMNSTERTFMNSTAGISMQFAPETSVNQASESSGSRTFMNSTAGMSMQFAPVTSVNQASESSGISATGTYPILRAPTSAFVTFNSSSYEGYRET